MTRPPFLSRVLVTNDDGFDAPGLGAMIDVAHTIAQEVWVIAPAQDQSGMGQSITLNAPVRATPHGDKMWAIAGTPADCVIMGVSHFMTETPPELVLSGVNAGNNTGDDANISGTLGAAFTSLMLGVPALAVSIDCASRKLARWDTARALLPKLLADFLRAGWGKDLILSVNLPDLPPDRVGGLCWTRPARKTISSFRVDKREDLREKDYYWLCPNEAWGEPEKDTDVAALTRGQISVSGLTISRSPDLTQELFRPRTANDE